MSYSPEFARLTDEKAEELNGLVSTVLVPYYRDHQWIPETLHPELFPTGSGFDFTLSTRSGTPLNDLTTNIQRFLVDNSEQWQALLAGRRAVAKADAEDEKLKRREKEIADATKPKKIRS